MANLTGLFETVSDEIRPTSTRGAAEQRSTIDASAAGRLSAAIDVILHKLADKLETPPPPTGPDADTLDADDLIAALPAPAGDRLARVPPTAAAFERWAMQRAFPYWRSVDRLQLPEAEVRAQARFVIDQGKDEKPDDWLEYCHQVARHGNPAVWFFVRRHLDRLSVAASPFFRGDFDGHDYRVDAARLVAAYPITNTTLDDAMLNYRIAAGSLRGALVRYIEQGEKVKSLPGEG